MNSTRILTALLLATTLVAAAPAQIFGIFPGPDEAPMQPLDQPPIFDHGGFPMEDPWEDPADWDQCLADGLCIDFPPFMFGWDEGTGLFYDPDLDLYFDADKGLMYFGGDPSETPILQVYAAPSKPQGGGAGKKKPTAKTGKKKPTSKTATKRPKKRPKPTKKKS